MPSTTLPVTIRGKVIVAGAANAGKTCLLERFVRNVYVPDEDSGHGPTVGCDCLQKSVYVEDTEVTLFLYDTAGQERFADMSGNYYRQGDVCLLVFDVVNPASYSRIKWWMEKVREYNQKVSFILVGCKEDLLTNTTNASESASTAISVASTAESATGNSIIHPPSFASPGNPTVTVANSASDPLAIPRSWAQSFGMPFFTTSAKQGGQAIQFLFYSVAEKCIRQARERQIEQIQIQQKQQQIQNQQQFSLRSAFGRPDDDDDRDEDDELHNDTGDGTGGGNPLTLTAKKSDKEKEQDPMGCGGCNGT